MKHFIRFLLGYLCRLAAALAFLATLIALIVCIGMIFVTPKGGGWIESDYRMFWHAFVVTLVGVPATWLLQALSRRLLGEKHIGSVRSFTLVRSASDWQATHFLPQFNIVVWLAIFCWWIWSHNHAADPWARVGQTAAALGVLFLGLHLRVLLHELGHLTVAWALGMDRVAVQLGGGPVLWQGQWKPDELWWVWRLWPVGGFVNAVHRQSNGFRRRQWLFSAAGPAVDGCLLWMGYRWIKSQYGDFSEAFALDTLGGALAWTLVVVAFFSIINVMAHTIWLGDKHLYTDGWWLWRLPRMSHQAMAGYLLNHRNARLNAFYAAGQCERAWEVFREIKANHPDQANTLLLTEAALLLLEKNFAGAIAGYERALAQTDLTPDQIWSVRIELAVAFAAAGEPDRARQSCEAALADVLPENRVAMLDTFACLPIMRGAKALLPDAERWIAEALVLAPDRLSLQGTRASLLVEQDCLYEAEAPLREIHDKSADAADRGICAFYLALLIRRRNGPAREWKRWRRRALRLCPQPWLLERARTELVDLPE